MQFNTRFLSKNLAVFSLALFVAITGGLLVGCQGDTGVEETEEETMEEDTETEDDGMMGEDEEEDTEDED